MHAITDWLGSLAGQGKVSVLGYFAGNAYSRIEAQVGHDVAIAVAAVVIAALVVWHLRRRRRTHAPSGESAKSDEAEPVDWDAACPQAAPMS